MKILITFFHLRFIVIFSPLNKSPNKRKISSKNYSRFAVNNSSDMFNFFRVKLKKKKKYETRRRKELILLS